MHLRVSDRTIWIVSPAPEVARGLATVALEEGARVAVFSHAAQQVVRSLRSRFGLRTLACASPAIADRSGRHLRTAARWGGPPFGLIIHLVGREPLAAHRAQLQAFCDELGPDGAVLIMREAAGADEAELIGTLEGDLDVARTFVHLEARVSLMGCLTRPGAGTQRAVSRLAEPACGAFAIFFIGRGGANVTLIGQDGLIHAVPSARA
jgi:hypothetical protein